MSNSPFLDAVLPLPAPPEDRYIWAKVTQVSPLRIQVDGDRTPLGITPDTLTNALAVNQRVYCQIINRRLIVLGASGGDGVMAATPNTVVLRDTLGRMQAAAASAAADVIIKSQMDAAISALGAVKFGAINIVVLTTSGNYLKPANLLGCIVECVGGGGGGGSSGTCTATQVSGGNGGGGGGYTKKFYLASALSASEAYVIGAGGAGTPFGSHPAAGTTGGATTFKGMTASGGVGGVGRGPAASAFNPAAAPAGGAATGGDVNIPGCVGGTVWGSASGPLIHSGEGGASFLGFGAPTPSVGNIGVAGPGYGSGGSGASGPLSETAHSGGAGAAGVIIITEFLSA